MRLSLFTLALSSAIALGQDPVPQLPSDLPVGEQAVTEEPAPEDPIAPWQGTLAEGVDQVRAQADAEEWDAALLTCDRLLVPGSYERLRGSSDGGRATLADRVLAPLDGALQSLGVERLSAADRALVRYQRGLILVNKGDLAGAMEDLGLARSLGGAGSVRRDAVYALGTLDLMVGEVLRQQIPEISGAPPTPPPPTADGQAEEAPDPLVVARTAYSQARTHLIERLRLDWRDEDSRANMELIQRRLRELDEIERQREEQSQEPEDNQEGEPSDEEQEGGESQDSDQESEPEDPNEDPNEDPSEESESEEPEESGDPQEQDSEDGEESEAQAEPEELQLTQEELERLLRILRDHEEEGERLREALLRQRRVQVEKDW
ncbi:hypothetical protein CMO84_02890 [Candidatus Woesearchaeota archaeon]|nr:hypothetical protein [Candidatus Woesearchaeota archaeon]